jgi:hypothetical protein
VNGYCGDDFIQVGKTCSIRVWPVETLKAYFHGQTVQGEVIDTDRYDLVIDQARREMDEAAGPTWREDLEDMGISPPPRSA